MPRRKSVRPARPIRAAPARPQRTELSELETAEAELRIIHDAMACGLIVLSPEWRVLRMNAAAEAILGWRLAELRERPFRSPLSPSSRTDRASRPVMAMPEQRRAPGIR